MSRVSAAIETAVRMAGADAKAAAARQSSEVANGDAAEVASRELQNEARLLVPEWDFVSKHAIEQEYVETIASSVTLV